MNRTGDIGVVAIVGRRCGGGRPPSRGDDGRCRAPSPHGGKPQAARGRRPAENAGRGGAGRLAALLEDRRKLERELQEARRKLAMGGGSGGERSGPRRRRRQADGARRHGVEMRDLKSLADEGKKRLGSGVVAIVGVAEDGKAGIVVGVTEDLTAKIDAVGLVRAARKNSAARAAAGVATWRRPAGRTVRKRRRPSQRSKPPCRRHFKDPGPCRGLKSGTRSGAGSTRSWSAGDRQRPGGPRGACGPDPADHPQCGCGRSRKRVSGNPP